MTEALTCYSTHFLQTVCSSSSLLFVSVQAHNICSGYIRVYEMEETSGSWIVKMFGPSVASIDNFASCFSFQDSGSFWDTCSKNFEEEVQLNGHHLTGAIGQLPLETFKSVMFHVLGLVAPLVHDEGEDAEGDGVHWEGTDHCRADPSEKKAMSLLFQAELQRKQLVKGCWLAKGACLKAMQGSPVLLRATKVVRLKSRLDDVLWICEHPG